MGCCDQHRQAAARPVSTRTDAALVPAARAASARVRYLGRTPVSVRGAATARLYQFDSKNTTQVVDSRDVVSIVRTGLFRPA